MAAILQSKVSTALLLRRPGFLAEVCAFLDSVGITVCVLAAQVFQDALSEAEHFLATGETPRGFEMGLVPEGGDAAEDGTGAGGSGGHPRGKPRDGKGVSKKDGANPGNSVFRLYFQLQSAGQS